MRYVCLLLSKLNKQICLGSTNDLKKKNSLAGPCKPSKNLGSGTGFTLIELLIYLSLVSGIMIAATTFAWNIINSRTKAFAIQEVEQNGRLIMEEISQAAHQAGEILTPAIGEQSDQLSLAMRDMQFDPTDFTVQNGRLYFSRGGNQPVALSSGQVIVSSFSLYNLTTPNMKSRNLKIILELQHQNPEQRQEWQATETFETTIELKDSY